MSYQNTLTCTYPPMSPEVDARQLLEMEALLSWSPICQLLLWIENVAVSIYGLSVARFWVSHCWIWFFPAGFLFLGVGLFAALASKELFSVEWFRLTHVSQIRWTVLCFVTYLLLLLLLLRMFFWQLCSCYCCFFLFLLLLLFFLLLDH